MKKESIGARGKQAEKTVEAILKKWNGKSTFAYWRLPDARSARSFLSAQPGDFGFYCGANAGIIEVKSTTHAFRIAKDKISQLAVLTKLEMAGAKSVILINHSVEGVWRAVLPTQLEIGLPSWNLSEFKTYASAEEALKSTGYF